MRGNIPFCCKTVWHKSKVLICCRGFDKQMVFYSSVVSSGVLRKRDYQTAEFTWHNNIKMVVTPIPFQHTEPPRLPLPLRKTFLTKYTLFLRSVRRALDTPSFLHSCNGWWYLTKATNTDNVNIRLFKNIAHCILGYKFFAGKPSGVTDLTIK